VTSLGCTNESEVGADDIGACSINPRSDQMQTPLGATKLDSDILSNFTRQAANPSPLEIYPVFLQQADDPVAYATLTTASAGHTCIQAGHRVPGTAAPLRTRRRIPLSSGSPRPHLIPEPAVNSHHPGRHGDFMEPSFGAVSAYLVKAAGPKLTTAA
jgi:hypothetical protein